MAKMGKQTALTKTPPRKGIKIPKGHPTKRTTPPTPKEKTIPEKRPISPKMMENAADQPGLQFLNAEIKLKRAERIVKETPSSEEGKSIR
jgi:hypothetical protein